MKKNEEMKPIVPVKIENKMEKMSKYPTISTMTSTLSNLTKTLK